jgi:hypothetical protein
MNAQSPINLEEDEQQYLELTKEYRNYDEMRFRAHRLKYKLEDRAKSRSLKVVSKRKPRDCSPAELEKGSSLLKDIDTRSDAIVRGGFKIHLEKTQRLEIGTTATRGGAVGIGG